MATTTNNFCQTITISEANTEYSGLWYHTDKSSVSADGLYDVLHVYLYIKSTAENSYTVYMKLMEDVSFGWAFQIRALSTSGTELWSCAPYDFPSTLTTTSTKTFTCTDDVFYIYGLCQADDECGMSEGRVTSSSSTYSTSDSYAYMQMFKIDTTSLTWYTAPTYSDGNYGIKNVTGKTISVRMFTYSAGSDSITTHTIRCVGSSDSYDKTVTVGSDACTTFTGLTNGYSYSFTFYATDGTTPKTLSASATTYACTLACSSDNITSRCAKVTYTNTKYWSTGGSKSGKVTLNSTTKTISTGGTGTWTDLTHKTTYSISAYVSGLYTFDTSTKAVTTTAATDATATLSITTKELTLSGVVNSVGQHTVSTTWTSKVGGTNRYYDALVDTYVFTMSYTMSSNNATGSGYIVDTGSYSDSATLTAVTQTFTRSDLTYYCSYSMTVSLSDGVNIVTATVTFVTVYPYARIYYDGAWHKAFVYLYDGSAWKLVVGHLYNSSWREFNGE